jgi:3-hydroxyisobutyrate dehydrogenase-like beta-hydroxyacid dehydrogenase
MRVGLIGPGLMGHGIGKNIVDKGFSLKVLGHRNRDPVEDLLGRGAKEAANAREIAETCDTAIICVTGSPQVEAVVFGEQGLLGGMGPGFTVLDCTTADPTSTRRIAAAVAERGGHYLDTPMVRTPIEAEQGRLNLMIGGEREALERVRPVLETFTEELVPTGPVGSAHTLKLVHNYLALGAGALICEGISTAMKAGVDMDAMNKIVGSGGANSTMFQRLMKHVLENDDTGTQFTLQNAEKDLRYYTNMAEMMPSLAFIAEATHQTYVMAKTMGYGDKYVSHLVDLLAEVNGIDGQG